VNERKLYYNQINEVDNTKGAIVVSSKVLNPGPLGLAAFAMTTTVLSLYNLGVLAGLGKTMVIPLAIAYGGLIQLFVGMWEAKAGNTFGFTAFTSYGAFWIYYALVGIFSTAGIVTAEPVTAGVVLVLWGFLTFYLWIASLKANKATNLVFLFLFITFVLLGIGDISGVVAVTNSGGFMGIVTAAVAWYVSAANVINDGLGKQALPLGKPFK